MDLLHKAADAISNSHYTVGFTGAGISVESGIPPFRGEGGLWQEYDPSFIDITTFRNDPAHSWELIKKLFYNFMGKAEPNGGHRFFSYLEKEGSLKSVITQNIDGLHQAAGNRDVIEYHGTTASLKCTACGYSSEAQSSLMESLPVLCPECQGLMKPDFVFFGEQIPSIAQERSIAECAKCDLMIVVGTTGEVMPACQLPYMAKQNGATIIEINPEESAFSRTISDIYIPLKAGEAGASLTQLLQSKGK